MYTVGRLEHVPTCQLSIPMHRCVSNRFVYTLRTRVGSLIAPEKRRDLGQKRQLRMPEHRFRGAELQPFSDCRVSRIGWPRGSRPRWSTYFWPGWWNWNWQAGSSGLLLCRVLSPVPIPVCLCTLCLCRGGIGRLVRRQHVHAATPGCSFMGWDWPSPPTCANYQSLHIVIVCRDSLWVRIV
jgi:hypothetical protein